MVGDIVWPGAKVKLHLAELFERPDSETRRERLDRHMQGLRKILRALGIVLLPLVGTVIIYGGTLWGKRQSFWRAAEFWLLLAAAFVSMLSVTVWIVIPLTLAGLSISSLPKYIELWPRAERVGAQGEWWKTVALSAFNRLAAAVAALVLGNLARWVWWWILLRGSCTY
jgi:hypothetical protein